MLDENKIVVFDDSMTTSAEYTSKNTFTIQDLMYYDRIKSGMEADDFSKTDLFRKIRRCFREEVWKLIVECFPDGFDDNNKRPSFGKFLKNNSKLKEICYESYCVANGDKSKFEYFYNKLVNIGGKNTTGKAECLFPVFFKDVSMVTNTRASGDLIYNDGKTVKIYDVKCGGTNSFGLPKYVNSDTTDEWMTKLGVPYGSSIEELAIAQIRSLVDEKHSVKRNTVNAVIFVSEGGTKSLLIDKWNINSLTRKFVNDNFVLSIHKGYEGVSMKYVGGNAMKESYSKNEYRRPRGRMLKETVIKKGLEWLADKVSEKTGLEFYRDPQSVDYTEEDNVDGLVDYIIAKTDFGYEYLCKYDNGDFEVAIWDDDEESPQDTFRDPNPFAVAKYAIENTPFKPAIADESRRPRGRMLKEDYVDDLSEAFNFFVKNQVFVVAKSAANSVSSNWKLKIENTTDSYSKEIVAVGKGGMATVTIPILGVSMADVTYRKDDNNRKINLVVYGMEEEPIASKSYLGKKILVDDKFYMFLNTYEDGKIRELFLKPTEWDKIWNFVAKVLSKEHIDESRQRHNKTMRESFYGEYPETGSDDDYGFFIMTEDGVIVERGFKTDADALDYAEKLVRAGKYDCLDIYDPDHLYVDSVWEEGA